MRCFVFVCAVLATSLPIVVGAADAPETTVSSSAPGIDLMQLLEQSAKRLNKRFIVDPRMRGNVQLVNVDPQRISYAELQAILGVHGFVATQEIEGTVRIIPEGNIRQVPMPVLSAESKNVGAEDMVMRALEVGPLNAVALVPILRPLLPQYAHMVAHPETNSLIVVARQANMRVIESIIEDLRARPIREVKQD